jgi:hypothetical protein
LGDKFSFRIYNKKASRCVILAHEHTQKFSDKSMNIAYTRLLKMGGRLREFNFRKQPNLEGTYHVDCTDERGLRFMFLMHQTAEGSWQVSSSELPAWIREAEGVIAATIVEEEAVRLGDAKRTA